MATKIEADSPAAKLMEALYDKFFGIGDRRIINENVWVEVKHYQNKCIAIKRIACIKRGEGFGSQALDIICTMADEMQCDLILSVEPFKVEQSEGRKALNTAELRKWYTSRGFRRMAEYTTTLRRPFKKQI